MRLAYSLLTPDPDKTMHPLNFLTAFVLVLTFVSVGAVEQTPFEPRADPKAQVTLGAARFTILTSHLIRYYLFHTFLRMKTVSDSYHPAARSRPAPAIQLFENLKSK